MLLLEFVLVTGAQFLHGREIHFVEGGKQRLRGLRRHQPLGDARAQACHGHATLDATAGPGSGDMRRDIGLGHRAACAAALHCSDVDTGLGCRAPRSRAGLDHP